MVKGPIRNRTNSKTLSKKKLISKKPSRRRIEESSNDEPFQNVISGVAAPPILEEFTKYLGRDGVEIITEGTKRSTRQVNVPAGFSGLAFDGVHWKGYENGRVAYNSYSAGLQMENTNNYCQSYAAYLWAKEGAAEPFIEGDYTNNVKLMSQLWLNFFKDVDRYTEDYGAFIKKEFEVPHIDNEGIKIYPSLPRALLTLNKLTENDALASEFSRSQA